MNADASQPALPLGWFLALIAAAALMVAVTLLADRRRERRRRDRAAYRQHCDQVLRGGR